MWTTNAFRDPIKLVIRNLSIKSLYNMRLTCKDWNYFISDIIKRCILKTIKDKNQLDGLTYGYKRLVLKIPYDFDLPDNITDLRLFSDKDLEKLPPNLKILYLCPKESPKNIDLIVLPSSLEKLVIKINRNCNITGQLPDNLLELRISCFREINQDLKWPSKLRQLSIATSTGNIKFPSGLKELELSTTKNVDLSYLHELEELCIYGVSYGPSVIDNIYVCSKVRKLRIGYRYKNPVLECNNPDGIVDLRIYYLPKDKNNKPIVFKNVKYISTSVSVFLELLNNKQIDPNKLKIIKITGFLLDPNEIDCSVFPEFPRLELISFSKVIPTNTYKIKDKIKINNHVR